MAVTENRIVEVVGPVEEWADEFPGAASIARDGQTESYDGGVPMPGRDGPVGSILAIRNKANPFSARHKAILEALANQAVIAIENARLIQRTAGDAIAKSPTRSNSRRRWRTC